MKPTLDRAGAAGRVRTLLRFAYGLLGVAIIAGVAWQWEPTHNIAAAVLASGALFAVVVGLAAQGTLANPISGIVLAFAQPFSIGDHVKIAGNEGTVVRIGVAYTRLDLGDGSHAEIPNALLSAATIIVNR